jgi:hypothetical protein
MEIGDKLTRVQLVSLIFVWAALAAGVLVVVCFFWKVNRQTRMVEDKVAQIKRLSDHEVSELARACAELGEREAGLVAKEDWPEEVRELSPMDVTISNDDVQLYFSGGHLPFVMVCFEKRDGGKLELFCEDHELVLWPQRGSVVDQ